jgi:hypothetical protein
MGCRSPILISVQYWHEYVASHYWNFNVDMFLPFLHQTQRHNFQHQWRNPPSPLQEETSPE